LLCGDLSVLDEASELFVEHSDLLDGVERLRQLSLGLLNRYPNLRISIDLSELRGFNYHTGAVFSAYDAGSGQLVARGGRYDNVGELFGRSRPATGFDIEISSLVDLLPEPDTGAWVVVNRSQGADHPEQTQALWIKIESLRAEGYRVIEGEPPVGIEGYQLVLDANEWVLRAL
jgi:ATP phosphoribosyltransferase regulatory subunit